MIHFVSYVTYSNYGSFVVPLCYEFILENFRNSSVIYIGELQKGEAIKN